MTKPIRFAEGHYAGGQPAPEDLAALAREGVRTVINLRTPDERVDYDEATQAGRLGLSYVCLPVAGADDLDPELVRRFGQALDDARREGGVLIHCASSNRVGALIALDEVLNRGSSLEFALERGRNAGLKSLDPAVVALTKLWKEGLFS